MATFLKRLGKIAATEPFGSPVDVPPMASREHKHDQPIVLDLANQSIGADPITPETMPCAAQCSPMAAWTV